MRASLRLKLDLKLGHVFVAQAVALNAGSLRALHQEAAGYGGGNNPDATFTAQIIKFWRIGNIDRDRDALYLCRFDMCINHRTCVP